MTDYETAKQKLGAIEKRWSDYDGNNPDKYASEMREAASSSSPLARWPCRAARSKSSPSTKHCN